jgi:hypothetical protein
MNYAVIVKKGSYVFLDVFLIKNLDNTPFVHFYKRQFDKKNILYKKSINMT